MTPDIRFSTFNRWCKESGKKQKEAKDEVFGHRRPQPGSNSRRSTTTGGSYSHRHRRLGIHRGNQSLVAAGLYAWQDVPLHRDVKCKVYHGCTIRRAVALSPNMGYMAHYGTDSVIPIHRCCTNMMASHFRKILSFGSYLHGLTGQYLADLSIPSKNLFESFIPEQQCAT